MGTQRTVHPPRESSNTSGQTDYDIVARLEKGQLTRKQVGLRTPMFGFRVLRDHSPSIGIPRELHRPTMTAPGP